MSRLQEIGGEVFNVQAIQKIVGRAKRDAYPSDRAMIDVVGRLIDAYQREVNRLNLMIQNERRLIEYIIEGT